MKVLILINVSMPVFDETNETRAIRNMCIPFPVVIIAVSFFSKES